MEGSITRLAIQRGDRCAEIDETIAAGEEAVLTLPFEPESVRAYQGEREICVHWTEEA
jgi:hypothetical protein